MKKYIIIGSGALGVNLYQYLMESNKEVVLLNRSGTSKMLKNANILKCDLNNKVELAKCISKDSIVFNCIGLPYHQWSELIPITKNLIEVIQNTGSTLVYADNMYAYGDISGKFDETTPYHPTGKKTEIRGTVSNLVMQAHKNGQIKAVIARSSDFYGPYVTKSSVAGPQVIDNILKNKKALYIGKTDILHSYTYIEDFAKALSVLADDPSSYGEIWHVPTNDPITINQTIKIMEGILNKDIKKSSVSKGLLHVISIFNKELGEFKELIYMFIKPFVPTADKFMKKYPDFAITDYKTGFKKTIDWYKNEYTPDSK